MANALDAAISGLKVSQRSIDVISGNIANASTEGYTRKILPQEPIIISGEVAGVLSGAVYRNVDESLLVAEQDQVGITRYHETKAYYLDRIMQFHGASDANKAISSKVASLKDNFVNLASYPNSTEALTSVLSDAQSVADEFNNFSKLINDLRNQTESDLESSIEVINISLEQIAKLNAEITKLASSGSSAAALEDQRDIAVKTVSEYIDVNTYFENEKLVLITKQGTTLVDSSAKPLVFNASNVTSAKYYPNNLTGIFVDGEDITSQNLGGKIEALFELRDTILPQYEAQIDELAQKLSFRFEAEGLRLFNDQYGDVPTNSAPPAITGYVGYAGVIQVNQDILNNSSLLRHGTTGNTEAEGSIEVIKRVVEYTFGTYAMQEAQGNVDIRSATIGGDLNDNLPIVTHNRITGSTTITTYPTFADLPNSGDLPGSLDITLEGVGTQTIAIAATDTAATLVTNINTAFGDNVASLNSDGALAFNHDGDITLAANVGDPLNITVLQDLGFSSFGLYAEPNPKFSVQLGARNPVEIEILDTDDHDDLATKIDNIDGITATVDVGTGLLTITPDDGGELTLLNIEGDPLTALGLSVINIEHDAFRSDQIGPNPTGNLSTDLLSKSTIIEYSSSIVSNQAESTRLAENRAEQEYDYLETLETRNANTSGVNIDEEMADLIRIQANYSAAAQMVSNIIKMFDTLLNAFN